MAGPEDRRAQERIPVNSRTGCAFAGRMVDDVGPVKIRDVSLDGIGLVLMRAVPVGAVLVLGLTIPDKAFARTVMAKVAHVTPIPGGFLVGAAFTEPLSYQDLTALVM